MKDFFNPDKAPEIPKELDWENMEQGIRNKMEILEKEEGITAPGAKVKKRYTLLLLLLVALIMGLPVLYYYWPQASNLTTQEVEKTIPEKEKAQYPVTNTPAVIRPQDENTKAMDEANQKVNIPASKGQTIEPSENITNKASSTSAEIAAGLSPNPINEQTLKTKAKKKNQATTPAQSTNSKAALSAAQTTVNENLPAQESNLSTTPKSNSQLKQAPNSSAAQSENLANNTPSAPKAPKSQSTVMADSLNKVAQNKFEGESVVEKAKKDEKAKSYYAHRQFILESGPTIWNYGQGKNNFNKDRYERPLLSFQIQGNYVRGLKNNFFFMTGFQYQQLESKFQYSTTIPDYTITLRDTIIQVRNNSITGQQEYVYGDVEQTVKAERYIIHYNSSRLFKVSLAAGKSWNFKSFKTDIYLGASVNTLAFHSGRTLVNDELVTYRGSNYTVIDNQFGMEAFAGARVHYFLNSQFALTGSLQWQQSLMNWSVEDNAAYYPWSFGLQLGVSYTLP